MSTPQAPPSTSLNRVLPGLLLALLLAMLDSTIVATALPTIAGDLGGFKELSWVAVAYLLTTTVSTPLWGKLSDLLGRKILLQVAITIFVIGSALSGLAPGMNALIAFRAIQGVGAGGLWVGVMAVIGALAPPKERGKYQSYIAALSAVATICGPLIGGLFADHGLWRFAFYINVPIGVLAFIIIGALLHMPRNAVSRSFDYVGALFISIATIAVIVLTNWTGTNYGWGSPISVVLEVVTVLAAIAAVFVERRAAGAIFPPPLFSSRNFSLSLILGFAVGIALYSSIIFLPIYQQSVHNFSATQSGLLLLPLLGGMLVSSTWSGPVMSRTGAYREIMGGGFLALAIGSGLLSLLGAHTSTVLASIYMVIFGLGLGFAFQNVLVITQNSVTIKDIGAASGALTYFRNVGGSLGVSLFAAIFVSQLSSYLAARLPLPVQHELTANGGRLDSSTVINLSPHVRSIYANAVGSGIHLAFLVGTFIFAVAFILSLGLKPAAAKQAPPPTASAAPDANRATDVAAS